MDKTHLHPGLNRINTVAVGKPVPFSQPNLEIIDVISNFIESIRNEVTAKEVANDASARGSFQPQPQPQQPQPGPSQQPMDMAPKQAHEMANRIILESRQFKATVAQHSGMADSFDLNKRNQYLKDLIMMKIFSTSPVTLTLICV